MTSLNTTQLHIAAALVAGATLALQPVLAQLAGLQRTDLLRRDLSVAEREAIQVRVDFGPGTSAPAHTHPGEEIAYVLEGTLEYQIEGGTPITLHAGQSLFVPAGASHSARNVGSGKASELATYFVEKGRPLIVSTP